MGGKWKIALILLVAWFKGYSQYVYTYTDPCTGVINSVTITQPSGSVTLFYAGQYQTFTATQLQAGAFEAWVAQINASTPPGSNPCAGNGGAITTGTNVTVGTNTVNNVSGIVGIAANIGGSIGTSSVPGGGVTGGGNSNTGNNDNSSNNSNNNSSSNSSGSSSTGSGSGSGSGGSSSGTNGNGGNSGGSSSSGSSSGSGGSGGSGTGGSGSTGGSGGSSGRPEGGSGATGNPSSGQGESGGGSVSSGGTTEGGTSEGALGGSDNTTTASGGESESGGESGGGGGDRKQKNKQEKVGRGALIGAGDFVIIRNGNDITKNGGDNFRFNTSLTHVNTKQNFIKGLNFNFTTGENVLNTTFYGSYKTKTFMGVFSNSTMTNFKSDIFNTTTALAAQKTGPATWMLGTNFTMGSLGKSSFQNWSVVGGGFTNFKGGKTLSANIMALGIYSPYIFYYEGQWYRSGILLVPLANIDFKLTDKFKWSISFSGAYQWNADILNFQLSTGTKILL